MGLNRYGKRRDKAEGPIIEALERAGFEVWALDTPCDLLVRKPSDPGGHFIALEVKSSRKTSGDYVRCASNARIASQEAFLKGTGTHIVTTPKEALIAVQAWGGEP